MGFRLMFGVTSPVTSAAKNFGGGGGRLPPKNFKSGEVGSQVSSLSQILGITKFLKSCDEKFHIHVAVCGTSCEFAS